MINVNQLTAQLAKMPDQALQQYAAMHKNDPYTVALALAESNRRKEMRSAAQGAGAAQQPKVVDQDIAQMVAPTQVPAAVAQRYGSVPAVNAAKAAALPEEVGIGSLSADNLRSMAAGGIVAFDEGGEVPRYNGEFQPGLIKYQQGPETPTPEEMAEYQRRKNLSIGEALGEMGQMVLNPITKAWEYVTRPGQNTLQKSLLQQETAARMAPLMQAYGTRAPYGGNAEVQAAADAAAKAAATPGGRTDLTGENTATYKGLSAPPAPRGPGGPGIAGLSSMFPKDAEGYRQEMENAQGLFPTADPFKEERTAINAARQNAVNQDLIDFNKDMEARGVAFKDREGRLKTREEDLGKQREQNSGLALLEAGLAMMSGTSRHAFENIGKGALVGTKAYKEGIEKINAAQEKLDDAFGRIEEYRRNEDTLTAKERRALQTSARNATTAGLENLLGGMEKAYGYNREDAKNIMSVLAQDRRTKYEQEQQNARTASTNATHLQGVQMQLELAKAPMMLRQTEADVDKWLDKQTDLKYADATVREAAREKELQRRLKANPILAQYATGPAGGGGAPDFVYQNGQLVPGKK